MKGDYVDITYRTGVGVTTTRIRARTQGATVTVGMPGRNDLFVTVEELNAADKPVAVLTCRFLASEVVAMVEGHEDKVEPAPEAMKRTRRPRAVAQEA